MKPLSNRGLKQYNVYHNGLTGVNGRAYYFVNGQYSTLSGILGPLDSTGSGQSTISFHRDGRVIRSFISMGGSRPREFNVDITGANQIVIEFRGNSAHALADVVFKK